MVLGERGLGGGGGLGDGGWNFEGFVRVGEGLRGMV